MKYRNENRHRYTNKDEGVWDNNSEWTRQNRNSNVSQKEWIKTMLCDCLPKTQHFAKTKSIRIKCEFCPMFSNKEMYFMVYL